MKKILFLTLFVLAFHSLNSFAQFNTSVKSKTKNHDKTSLKKRLKLYPDSSNMALCFSIDAGYQIPTGNMYNRFGDSKSIGFTTFYKTKSNFFIGATADYFFGKNVKEKDLFKNISTPDNNIITAEGSYAEIRLYERGYFIGPTFGYKSKLLSKNRNSGLSFWLSTGFFEHKIKILGDNLYQLSPSYKVGYDRLTNGFALKPAIYYFNISRTHLVNYRIGIEFLAGFTQGQRNINFDTGLSGRERRFDGMINLKACWFLPKFLYGGNREITY
ncbi:MAG: hypothetical protein RL065_968 [Bacteroidota bacterium]